MKEEDIERGVKEFFQAATRLLDAGVSPEDINVALQDSAKMMQQIVLMESLRGLAGDEPSTK